ncbi:methionine biosynthesis protein MetW [Aurantiacibacter poecillastricola]|uniref:methionine biosynthesis protein MetW n=1 Tax=Aurantiacibacter poecillastricola TaxID=3064385 RepID=UPI00273FB491|nr:methionine biosynthesis protein MetW [Aurantiacibacter sp. 219JJ12-13]MDP5260162.1 methionine biosynthesis protein MetW [Aurantiacibacter sp. 219JJ12-13]
MSAPVSFDLRPDLAKIAERLPSGSRVLDVGCGEGDLMEALQTRKACDARGMEIDPEAVAKAVSRGLSVVQGDANRDLADYPDSAFDVAILSQTLQTAQRPDWLLEQLLRVGREAFVSFPNFAYWRMRLALLRSGRMPITRHLPGSWYATDNIHHLTVTDFREFLTERGVQVTGNWFFANGREIGGGNANWRAEHAVFQLSR